MRLRSGVEWRIVDGEEREVVVLDLASGRYLAIGGSGVELWPLVVDGTCEAKLADQLVATFGIDASRARADAAAFLAQLREHRLLDGDGDAAAGDDGR